MKPLKQTMEKFQKTLEKEWPIIWQDPSHLFENNLIAGMQY